jgi:hypothetical protein
MIDIDGVLEKTYHKLKNVWGGDWVSTGIVPYSKVFYVREALKTHHGTNYPLDHIEIAMWLEGFLPPGAVKSIPAWYVKAYMKGVKPDMKTLATQVEELYNARQKAVEALPVSSSTLSDTTPTTGDCGGDKV